MSIFEESDEKAASRESALYNIALYKVTRGFAWITEHARDMNDDWLRRMFFFYKNGTFVFRARSMDESQCVLVLVFRENNLLKGEVTRTSIAQYFELDKQSLLDLGFMGNTEEESQALDKAWEKVFSDELCA
jgi:hypothetical protein